MIEDDVAPHCGNAPTVSAREAETFGFRLDNGSLALAYWNPVNHLTSDYEGAVTMVAPDLGEVHLVDLYDGTVYELPPEMIERDEFGAVTLRLLPIRDYPLMLVFGEIV